jgi:hypothetical protein
MIYASTPTRTLTVNGVRLWHAPVSGETVVGHAVIPKSAYGSVTPVQITVPLPDTLPAVGVHMLVSDPLPDPVPLSSPNPQQLDLTIAGVTVTVTFDLPSTPARGAILPLLERGIHDAAPPHNRAFTGLRVGLIGDRLVLVAGGLNQDITAASHAPSSIADDLALTATQLPGVANGALSGALVPFYPPNAPRPSMLAQIGAPPAFPITLDRPTSLDDAANKLQTALQGAGGGTAYANARVTALGDQLLVLPGVAADVVFAPSPADDRSVAELQLRARYAVRARVNGAESIDDISLALPQ